LQLSSALGITAILVNFDFIYLGIDFMFIVHYCSAHPPLCTKITLSTLAFKQNSATHFLEALF